MNSQEIYQLFNLLGIMVDKIDSLTGYNTCISTEFNNTRDALQSGHYKISEDLEFDPYCNTCVCCNHNKVDNLKIDLTDKWVYICKSCIKEKLIELFDLEKKIEIRENLYE